jgi:hypothetical protein
MHHDSASKVVLGGGQSGRGQFEGTDERPTQRHPRRRVRYISQQSRGCDKNYLEKKNYLEQNYLEIKS